MAKSNVFAPRGHFKPMAYEWAFAAYHEQQKAHWLPEEVPLHEDVVDWKAKLTVPEKNLLTQIFRFFTQGDIDVSEGYVDKYLPIFRHPELRMMLMAFANMEAVHVHAYSLLLEEIGMPEVEYRAFQKIKEMAAKHDFVTQGADELVLGFSDAQKTAFDIAIFSAFTEGLHLFSSFAILLNFTRFGKMKGMGQIVTWSIRDESMHVAGMTRLFRTITSEDGSVMTPAFVGQLVKACRTMVALEDDFIDLCFTEAGGEIEGLTAADMKLYTRFIADRRMQQLGVEPIFGVETSPLGWLTEMLNVVEHANFFETRATEYSKGSATGNWQGDVWGSLQPAAIDAPAAAE